MASSAALASARAVSRELAPASARHLAVPWTSLDTPAAIADWDALSQRASEPNPFFASWYLLPSLRAIDPQGKIRVFRFEQDDRLAGLVPLSAEQRYYRWPFPHLRNWVHANCFVGAPLVAKGSEHAFWRALFAHADEARGAALFLHLGHIPLSGALHDALIAVLTEQDRYHALVHREDRAMLGSSLGPDAYLEAALSAKKRKELRRQHLRLSELGALAVERRDDAAGIGEWTAAFLTLEASGWKGQAGSALASSPATTALFTDALAASATRGQLERLTLTLDGAPIAMLASFLAAPGAFSFKTAFDERYARYSPGVLLQRENLTMLARPEIAWADSCAAADHPMIDHLWRERRAIGRYSIAIGGPARRAAFRALAALELARSPQGVGR